MTSGITQASPAEITIDRGETIRGTRGPTSARRKVLKSLAIVAMSAGGFVLAGGTAAAAETPGDGWVRVAHLSPDTKSVDVKLTALAGGDIVSELDGVGYGAVSDYIDLAQGTYLVSMVPAGSPDSTAPMIQQSVDVIEGQPLTVAAYGRNADIETNVYNDDLTPPKEGEASIRVIQASTVVDSVDIATAKGLQITKDATQGAATNYASVPAGKWTLDLDGGAKTASATIDLDSGSVATLFVLDNSQGGLTVKPVVDAASASTGDDALPSGGIETGGGYLAARSDSSEAAEGSELRLGLVAGTAVAAMATSIALVRRRNTARVGARR